MFWQEIKKLLLYFPKYRIFRSGCPSRTSCLRSLVEVLRVVAEPINVLLNLRTIPDPGLELLYNSFKDPINP